MTDKTEDEARNCWCPFARAVTQPSSSLAPTSGNRFTLVDDECNCIASDCMAWRWAEADDRIPTKGQTNASKRGYCGLAGRPGKEDA